MGLGRIAWVWAKKGLAMDLTHMCQELIMLGKSDQRWSEAFFIDFCSWNGSGHYCAEAGKMAANKV
jgi:catechol-2,3-dioxygenase